MASRSAFAAAALQLWSILPCLLVLRAEVGQPPEESLYLWIDAHQARVLIGFEEDILIVSEGKMAPFTHDFRKAQQRMPAIPVNIHSMNFTWQAAGRIFFPQMVYKLYVFTPRISSWSSFNLTRQRRTQGRKKSRT